MICSGKAYITHIFVHPTEGIHKHGYVENDISLTAGYFFFFLARRTLNDAILSALVSVWVVFISYAWICII